MKMQERTCVVVLLFAPLVNTAQGMVGVTIAPRAGMVQNQESQMISAQMCVIEGTIVRLAHRIRNSTNAAHLQFIVQGVVLHLLLSRTAFMQSSVGEMQGHRSCGIETMLLAVLNYCASRGIIALLGLNIPAPRVHSGGATGPPPPHAVVSVLRDITVLPT